MSEISHDPDNKKPVPVQNAELALALLREEDATLADAVEKVLPSYAIRCDKAGESIEVDTLLTAARKGVQHLKQVRASPAKAKLPARPFSENYKLVMDRKAKAVSDEMPFVDACARGDLTRLKEILSDPGRLKNFSSQSRKNMVDVFEAGALEAAFHGHLPILEYLEEHFKPYAERSLGYNDWDTIEFRYMGLYNEILLGAAQGAYRNIAELYLSKTKYCFSPAKALYQAFYNDDAIIDLMIEKAEGLQMARLAAEDGRLSVFQKLSRKYLMTLQKADPEDKPKVFLSADVLKTVVEKGHEDIFDFIVEDTNCPGFIKKVSADRHDGPRSLSFSAAYHGRLSLLKKLKTIFASENIDQFWGWALSGASYEHFEVADYVLSQWNDMPQSVVNDLFTRPGNLKRMQHFLDKVDLNAPSPDDPLITIGARAMDSVFMGHNDEPEMAELLLARGIKIPQKKTDLYFSWAADCGHSKTLEFLCRRELVKSPEVFKKTILQALSLLGDMRGGITAKSLLHYVENPKFTNKAFKQAADKEIWNFVEFVRERDSSLTLQPEQQQKFEQWKRWDRQVRMRAPYDLRDENPVYFKKAAYEALLEVLKTEGYDDAEQMAFHAGGLFRTESNLLAYLEKWAKPGKQPLHDLIYMIKLPKTDGMNLQDWADAVLKFGPPMAELVKFSDRIASPCKSADGRSWSLVETQKVCAQFQFARGSENPALAALCRSHHVDEESFERALDIIAETSAIQKNMPDIVIEGEKFGLPGAAFRRLDSLDPRGLFLGQLTDCCQYVGSDGEDCAIHGYTSPEGGFFVVETAENEIIGQSWAWRGKKGELCLDSLERLGERMGDENWTDLMRVFAQALSNDNQHNISSLYVGIGGATPSKLSEEFNQVRSIAPKDYKGYRDSRNGMYKIWAQPRKKDTPADPVAKTDLQLS